MYILPSQERGRLEAKGDAVGVKKDFGGLDV